MAAFDTLAAIRYLSDDRGVQMLNFILLTLGLLVCNLIYCSQRITADVRHSRHAQVTWGLLALSGSLLAAIAMVWATLASLAQL
jgi:hypothetical protein